MKQWDEIKQAGSAHYRGSDVQVIDLIRDMKPEPGLTVLDIFALVNNIKYSYRQLQKGKSATDIGKMRHYTDMAAYRVKQTKRGI